MTLNRRRLYPFLLYIIVGLIILSISKDSFIMYCTCFLFQLILLLIAIKRQFFTLSVFLLLVLLSQGVNAVTYFIALETDGLEFITYGLSSYDLVFIGYRYIALFSFLLLLGFLLFRKGDKVHLIDFVTNSGRKLMMSSKKTISFIPILLLVLLFSSLTIWMYNNQIGILGLFQKQLPYHLTGILYYFRLIIANGLLVFLYLKGRNRAISLLLLSVYAVILGFTSLSRGAVSVLLLPIILESVITNKRIRAILSFSVFFIVFTLVTKARVFIYEQGMANIPISRLMDISVSAWLQSGIGFFDFINGFTSRLYGVRDVYLSANYHLCSFRNLVEYYLGVPISVIVPDMAASVFHKNLSQGMAFGVSVGYNGNMVLLANGSYYYVAIQAVLVFIILLIQEIAIHRVAINSKKDGPALFIIFLFGLSIIVLWQGLSMLFVYVITTGIFAVSKSSNTFLYN